MKRVRWLVVAFVVVGASLWAANPAQACEPCFEIWDLDQTAEGADLIIVGRKVSEGPSTGDAPNGGPDWIQVRVEEVLKGEVDANQIQVNSWDGMCDYGIVADSGSYVMFLAWNGEMYGAVNIGCAVRQYPVQGDVVDVDGQAMAMDAFASSLGLERPAVGADDEAGAGDVAVSDEGETPSAGGVAPEATAASVEETPSAGGGRFACLGVPGALGLVAAPLVARRRRRS